LNTVNDVGQPVFVHVGQRHGTHIPIHHQGLGLGQAAGPSVEFEIVKLPVGRYGNRSVRPAYFYVAVEERA
jgi:hypothetical protein